METSNIFIKEWRASFFDEGINANISQPKTQKKEWKYGILKLYIGKINFSQRKSASDKNIEGIPFEFEIHFPQIDSFNRSSSSLVFPAITVATTQHQRYWFSSFENRDETLLFLKYFFNSTVGEGQANFHSKDGIAGAHKTSMGNALLISVVDSNKSLETAGTMLIEQGHQLRNASVKMVEMNHNLAVASRFTQGLKSWLPRWRIPKSYSSDQESFYVFNKDDTLDIHSFPVLYRDVSPTVKGSSLQCIATVEKKSLSIRDDYQKLIQHLNWTDISRIQVVSAWELCITQYLIGEYDKKYSLVSIKVQHLLKHFEKYRPGKTEVISPDVESVWSQHERLKRNRNRDVKEKFTDIEQDSQQRPNDEEDFYNPRKRGVEVPSNQEMAELSNELTSLKSLALDVQKVQDEQLKGIDELTEAVTKETDKLSKLNKTMDRIL